jgi:hypothetical protein
MKKIIPSLFVLMAVLVGSSCMAASQTQVNSGMHFDWWEGDNDDVGLQFFIPIQAVGTSHDVSLELLGAYVYTEVNPGAGDKCSLSQMADTKLNISYGLFDRLPFDVLFGLGFNLPTGKTDLSGRQMVLIQPPDLFTLPFFGEGFNINPTVSAAKEWGTWVAGVGVGYTWRGEYDYNYAYQNFDPGDVVTVSGEIGKAFFPSLSGKLYAQYISYAKDTLDGEDFYQEGPAQLYGLGLTYDRQTWDLVFNTSMIFRGKNKLRQAGAFPTESNNCHGDELNASLVHQYRLNPETAFISSLRFLHISPNDYPSAQAYYVGKRQKISLGFGIEKAFSKDVKAVTGIDGFIMEDDHNWYHKDDDVTYKGVSLSAQVSKGF